MQILKFSQNSIPIATRPTKFSHEIYKTHSTGAELEWVGSVSHHVVLPSGQGSTAGIDRSLEKLQQNMREYRKEDAATR
jgi:hypothetical protein